MIVNLFISSCGLDQMFGDTPMQTLTPTLTLTPGIGVEVAGSRYKLTITGVPQESWLSSGSLGGFDKATCTLKPGYFLCGLANSKKTEHSAHYPAHFKS